MTKKTFITALAAVTKLLLYPNSWVVITASTVDQANKIVEDKIRDELILKLSPYLLYMYQKDWILITKPGDGYVIKNTLNNSTLKVLAPVDSSKGSRSTFTIYDEAAIMRKKAIDDIFDGMLFPRQAAYMNNPEYSKDKRWVEDSKSIYLTSSNYSFLWWYKTWLDCVSGYYTDKRTKYNVCASDFFVSIDNNLKTWSDYRRAKKVTSDIDFRMNYLNEAVGNSDDAFFSLESFKENQILKKCFRPPCKNDVIVEKKSKNVEKKENEIRLVVADFAWTDIKSGSNESDRSIAICMSGHWKKGKFEKHIDYIEALPTADDADGCAQRLKELREFYNADYVVPDARSGGEAIMNSLGKQSVSPTYGTFVGISGLTIAENKDYQVAATEKLEYYRYKAADPNAIPCLIPILGSASLNTAYWRATKKELENGMIKFLIGSSDRQADIEDSGEYYKMSPEQVVDDILPYGQTDALISEAVNLKADIKLDQIKLDAPNHGHRDRIVTLAMGILIFDLIENAWQRQESAEEIDLDDFDVIF